MEERTLLETLESFANIPAEETQQLRDQLLKRLGDIEELLDAADFEDRLLAACALARLDPAKADLMAVIIEGLRSHDEGHRVYAAFACRCLGPLASPAVMALTDVLRMENEHENPFGCNHALKALAAIGSASFPATPALVDLLRGVGPNTIVTRIVHAVNAADALAAIGGAAIKAIPVLRPCLGFAMAEDEILRGLSLAAARAVWHISGDLDASLKVATGLLSDQDNTLRAHAAAFLGEVGTAARPAIPALLRLRDDADDHVRRHAREALAKIGPEQLL